MLVTRKVARHALVVRITHWINVVAISFMLLSGLNIFNAHSALYWGKKADFAHPWLSIQGGATPKGVKGTTQIGPLTLDTTGVLGTSKDHGVMQRQGVPGLRRPCRRAPGCPWPGAGTSSGPGSWRSTGRSTSLLR